MGVGLDEVYFRIGLFSELERRKIRINGKNAAAENFVLDQPVDKIAVGGADVNQGVEAIFSQGLFDRHEFAGVPEILQKTVFDAGGKVVRRNLRPDVFKIHLKQRIY